MQSLEKCVNCFDHNALIDHVVTNVAFLCIKLNCLKDLNEEERQRVARLVFMALSESKKGSAKQDFPQN